MGTPRRSDFMSVSPDRLGCRRIRSSRVSHQSRLGNGYDESAMTPIEIAILAYPETSASVVFGMYDLFFSAGRDWGQIVEGKPGASVMRPRIVSRERESFTVGNGVPIRPEATL